MNVFLLLIIVAFVLGLIGAAGGFSWLLALGCLVFVADLAFGWLMARGRMRPRGRRPVR